MNIDVARIIENLAVALTAGFVSGMVAQFWRLRRDLNRAFHKIREIEKRNGDNSERS